MGLLDDAIRDHLDLKRRRGDDPTEIARMEREALGPVRRGPEPFEAPYHRRPSCEPDSRWARTTVAQETQAFDVLAEAQEREPVAASPVLVAAGSHDRLWFEQKPPQEVDF